MSTSESEKKYVNIALVGHVANGKTTLVERLTGVCTKRDSSEQKSGRTIKLGYANCLVWQCPVCDGVRTTGQADKKGKIPRVQCCSFDLEPVQYISFVDAPGHHSFVHTMIKGVTVVDAAILVTDVRQDKLQIQSIEHLAILEVLGVKNVLVIQNKIDLADDEQCRKHYNMLQRELKMTAAEGAPIIPISAQAGTGIDYVQHYIYQMAKLSLKNMKTFYHNVFAVIRSFDINRPNAGVDELKGGVLGGTVRGERGYQIGDRLEIRPGLIKGRNEYQILETEIRSIFSERRKCKDMARGGLYGVGTKLDPTLTKSDRLVGSLVGRPEDLPEVITEIEMKIMRMKIGDESAKIRKGGVYQLIIGSNVVRAKARKNKERKTWTMELFQPVCTVDRRCLIYSIQGRSVVLVGFGMFGDQSVYKGVEVSLLQTFDEYNQLLPGAEKKSREKVTIPVPKMFRENRNMIWGNMQMFCQVIHREPGQICTYIKQELCMEATVCDGGLRLFKTRLNGTKLQSVLRKFIVNRVVCEQCRGINTVMSKENKIQQVCCQNCGSSRSLLI